MLKRMLCLLILCLIVTLPALAEGTDADILTLPELLAWVDGYKARAMTAEVLNDPHAEESRTEDGYLFVYDFGQLYLDAPDLTEDSQVLGLVLYDPSETDLRGIHVDDSAQTVLDAYYNENLTLDGTRDEAMLYVVNQMPESASIGVVHRDGQRIQVIEYAVHEQLATDGEGYTDAGILYTLHDNNVTAIRVYGLGERLTVGEMGSALLVAENRLAQRGYAQVPTSLNGADLSPLTPDDLVVCGASLTDMTPEDAIAAFGEPLEDVLLDDDQGAIRAMTFDECEAIFLCGAQGEHPKLDSLLIRGANMEGPRAVRVGDTVASVINRFRHGEGAFEGAREVLYGDEASGTFGAAEYGEDASAIVRYGVIAENGKPVVMRLTFDQLYLSEILISVNE